MPQSNVAQDNLGKQGKQPSMGMKGVVYKSRSEREAQPDNSED